MPLRRAPPLHRRQRLARRVLRPARRSPPRWFGGLRWVKNPVGTWGTYVWQLKGRTEYYYGWANPYLWPFHVNKEDGTYGEPFPDEHTDDPDLCRWVPNYEFRWQKTLWITYSDWLDAGAPDIDDTDPRRELDGLGG